VHGVEVDLLWYLHQDHAEDHKGQSQDLRESQALAQQDIRKDESDARNDEITISGADGTNAADEPEGRKDGITTTCTYVLGIL